MAFCNKCGKEITNEDLFCPKCGNKIELEPSDYVKPEVEATEEKVPASEFSSMTREESIALAGKLATEYGALEKLKQEIDEAEAIIKRPLPEPLRHTAFKFFWPFFIVAGVVYFVVYLVVAALFIAGGSSGDMGGTAGGFIGLIAFAATLILGGNYARNKRDNMNLQESMRLQTLRGKIDEMKKKTATLKTKYSTKKKELSEYDDIVPTSRRTKQNMEKAKALLEGGKAENLFDAVRM